jgi:olefin beta-lactone synthetase
VRNFPGLDPAWSRHVTVLDADGQPHDWHVLDNGVTDPIGTLLCVHGNPTWSYLWRRLLAAAPPGWRVIAPDQLGMGFSQRPDAPRRLEQRVADLGDLTAALGVTGPVVTVAHDWGGIISLGWGLAHRSQLRGVVLTNTAVAQPPGDFGPVLIRASRALLSPVTVRTPVFVRAAGLLSRPALPRDVRAALAAPYRSASRRRAVGDFVADIPFSPRHPSRATLEAINTGIRSLDVPVLLLWGPRDPVFADRYLADLRSRLPQAVLHRYEGASHLLPEDAPQYATAVADWLTDLALGDAPGRGRTATARTAAARRTATREITAATHPDAPAPAAGADQAADALVHPTRAATGATNGTDHLTRVATTGGADDTTGHPAGAGSIGRPADGTGVQPADGTGHLVGDLAGERGPGDATVPAPWAALVERAGDRSAAVVEVGGTTTSWADLEERTRALAAGLRRHGLRPGDRVALLVPPSADLTAAVYGVWRAGGVIVVADKGLGLAGMRRALRGAAVDHVIAAGPGLAAARAMRLPGTLIATAPAPASARTGTDPAGTGTGPTGPGWRRAVATAGRAALRASVTLGELEALGRAHPAPEPGTAPDADCAVLFTSGATGPAKGVVYTRRQVAAQLALVRGTYGLGPGDRFVAAFAPFALLGPALGIGSAVPDVDVTRPADLTAPLLADAAAAVDATVVFASPAALRRVVATADALSGTQAAALSRVRLLMSAGAPVPAALLHALRAALPAAELHTPYGMTEALPLTDVSLDGIDAAGPGDGVCVGRPLEGVRIMVSPLSPDGAADGPLTDAPDVTGEVCAQGPHVKDRYDALWATERAASRNPGWHRTGDVGHLDGAGRLWIEGRLQHVIATAAGVVTPVGVEQRVESLDEVTAAAAAAVGPPGAQVVALVVVPTFPAGHLARQWRPGRRSRPGTAGQGAPPSPAVPLPGVITTRRSTAAEPPAPPADSNLPQEEPTHSGIPAATLQPTPASPDAPATAPRSTPAHPGIPDTAPRSTPAHPGVLATALRSVSARPGVLGAVLGSGRAGREGLVPADAGLADAVRKVAGVEVAAVLTTAALPVDIRHQSKVDRAAVARDAAALLAGG